MKKGFTLIELLAAITILALLTLIAVPAVTGQLKNNKNSLYNTQLNNIKSAAEMWGADNVFKLPDSDNCITLTLGYLKDLGYMDASVTNPKDGEQFDDNNTFVNIKKSGNNFLYEVHTEGEKCELVDEEI